MRSRQDLRALASAPHGGGREAPYPKELRPEALAPGWFADVRRDAALRFRVDDRPVAFVDRVFGPLVEEVRETVGDFVLARRDGLYAYQLAVVVDDLAMAIDDVVRGADLLASTARQIQLLEALGGERPAYAHVPIVVGGAGEKLSKRDCALSLTALRARGVRPQALVGALAFSLGLLREPTPCAPAELVPRFRWEALPRETWTLPHDFPALLAGVDRLG
jgi:glutamyl-tRNA synthetase